MDTAVLDLGTDFALHEPFIRATVAVFRRRYGGDEDQLFSDAQLLYLRVRAKYDPARGAAFRTWFRHVLWNRFISRRRYDGRRRAKGERIPEELLPSRGRPRRLSQVFGRRALSPKALEVVDLVTEPPPDIAPRFQEARHEPSACKAALRGLLKDLGWTPGEVADAFEEIADALRDLT